MFPLVRILSEREWLSMSEGGSAGLRRGEGEEEPAVTMLDVLQDQQELEDDANVR